MTFALLIQSAAFGASAVCQLPSVQQPAVTSSVTVEGAVKATLTIDRASASRYPQAAVVVDQPSLAGSIRGRFEGVLLVELLKATSPVVPSRKNSLIGVVVLARADDGYLVALSYAETDPDVARHPALVAFSCNGRAISPTLVLPGDLDSSRYVHELESLTVLDTDTTSK